MFDVFSPKLFYFAQIIPTFFEADVGGRKFTDIFTYDLILFQSGWWGRVRKLHSASFYWVHKTLNLTHLHICCHLYLSFNSCDARKNPLQNHLWIWVCEFNQTVTPPTASHFKCGHWKCEIYGIEVKSLLSLFMIMNYKSPTGRLYSLYFKVSGQWGIVSFSEKNILPLLLFSTTINVDFLMFRNDTVL